MPYRIDISSPPPEALDVLVELGALDLGPSGEGLAAILPDTVSAAALAAALPGAGIAATPATGRDDGSVWLLSPPPIRIGTKELRLAGSSAFGTGHHPTTALCIAALEELLAIEKPASMLDIGTGSGILALAALTLGVPRAVGVDIDAEAIRVAAENARWNGLSDRLELQVGGPEAVNGTWPLVVANVLAAPLIEMAPVLVRRLAPQGQLMLSGISWTLESEVRRAYQHLGMRHMESRTRAGWTMMMARTSW